MDQSSDQFLKVATGLCIFLASYGAILVAFRRKLFLSISRLAPGEKVRIYTSYKRTSKLLFIFLLSAPILLISIPVIMNRYLGISTMRTVILFALLFINVVEILIRTSWLAKTMEANGDIPE